MCDKRSLHKTKTTLQQSKAQKKVITLGSAMQAPNPDPQGKRRENNTTHRQKKLKIQELLPLLTWAWLVVVAPATGSIITEGAQQAKSGVLLKIPGLLTITRPGNNHKPGPAPSTGALQQLEPKGTHVPPNPDVMSPVQSVVSEN